MLLTGAVLAIAGVVMQQLVRNRFVEPGMTGTSEGAALGLLAVTLAVPGAPVWLRMVVAAAGAMATTALFLRLVRRLPPHEVLPVPLVGMLWSGTQRASQYVATMAKHFGTRIPVEVTGDATLLHFEMGLGRLEARGDGVALCIEAAGAEDVALLADVVERHLLRFAHRESPVPLNWSIA